MSCLTILLSPLNLLFFMIVAGLAIGRIRIKGISVGIAGILFAAIFVGFLINNLIPTESREIIENAQSTLKTFSKLGTALFVSVIGLQTGFSIKSNSKESVIAFAIGSLMSISGVMLMLLISVFDETISYPSLLGILCGALTSTPGLSSACELLDHGSEDAVLGYGSSYLLGVILVVFFAQVFSRKTDKEGNQIEVSTEIKSKIYPELMLLCITALLGNFFGNIKVAFFSICLGTTASTLIVGLIIGLVVNKAHISKRLSKQCLNIFRNLGLALFFVGTGFATGTQDINFDIKTTFYGALITLTAILFGWFLCKISSRWIEIHKGFTVAGGMTSSPAYSAIASDANESSINCFSFAYFGALILLVIALQIITR